MRMDLRRRALIAASQKHSRLPAGFRELEWIGVAQSGQYIVTDYTPKGDNPLKVEMRFAAENKLLTVFACRNGASLAQSLNFFARNDSANMYYYRQNGDSTAASYANAFAAGLCTGGWDDVTITTDSPSQKTATLNGTAYPLSVQTRGTLNNMPRLYIFARNSNRPDQFSAGGKLAVLRFFEGGTNPVHDYVPAERESDSELGLYDIITNTFLTNAGTGTFRKGGYV